MICMWTNLAIGKLINEGLGMKLNLIQFVTFSFMLGWILSDVAGGKYAEKLVAAISLALVCAYLNNAHGLLWAWMTKKKRLGSED